jgi:uncharacterized protein YjbI with pentapeptide repeats
MVEKDKIRERLDNASKGVCLGCRSLLVPLMIAVFTIITTVLQMNATREINEQNLRIAIDNRDIANFTRLQQLEIEDARRKLEREIEEDRREADKLFAKSNREQDLHIANETRIHQIAIEEARLEQERLIEDQRRAADFQATENRQMDSILGTFLKEMSEILLKDDFTLENHRWAIVVRAKTVTVLRQLDGKRKSYVIQFLYEAELLFHKRNPIDLNNADLNNIDMSGRKLENISLNGALLQNASFMGATLDNSNFNYAKLVKSTFEKAKLVNATFFNCDATESNFDGANLTGALFEFGRLIKTTWRSKHAQKIIFNKARIDDADFDDANLDQTSFYWTSLRGTSFKKASLQFVDWRSADLLGADLTGAVLRPSNITLKQLRQTFSYQKAKLPDGTQAGNVNLFTAGSAEHSTESGACSMYGWNYDKTVVTRTYTPNKVATSLGACFFTGVEGATRGIMRQKVKIDSTKYANNSRVWVYSRCRELILEDEFKIQFHLVQFDKDHNMLANHTLILSKNNEIQEHSCFTYSVFRLKQRTRTR